MDYPTYDPDSMTREQLVELVKTMDEITPRADETCTEPGITHGEAVWREIHDRRARNASHN